MLMNCFTELHGEGTENCKEKLCETLCASVQLRDIAFLFSINNLECNE